MKIIQGKKCRKIWITSLLAALFTAMEIAGYQISVHYHTTVHGLAFLQRTGSLHPGQWMALALCFFAAMNGFLLLLFSFLERYSFLGKFPFSEKVSPKGETGFSIGQNSFVRWLVWAVLLFLCWLPCFGAGYPGFYNYDAFSQVPQALYEEVPYSAHHPLLHTLLMGKTIAFGYRHGVDLNDGIALHSVLQMIVCAGALAFALLYIKKICQRRWLCVTAFCYYAFFPPIPMFALSTTKDTLFSVMLLFCVVFLYDMCRNLPGFFCSRGKMLRFFGCALLMCLFRKNGVYALICLIPFFMVLYKKYAKQILLLFCAVSLTYFTVDKTLLWALNAEEGSAKEMLSVPMQQIARVYKDQGRAAFSTQELSLIDGGISEEELLNYNPFLADNIKNHFDYAVIEENKTAFLSLWVRKGLQYPESYINAFLDNTYQAWYPGTSIVDDPGDARTYYFDMTMCAGGYRDTKLPLLLPFYEKIAHEFYYQRIPVLRLLFSIGAMLWVTLFTFSYALYQRKYPVLLSTLLLLFYCLTVLAGPIALVRYYLILFYCFPVCVGFCLEPSDSSRGRAGTRAPSSEK